MQAPTGHTPTASLPVRAVAPVPAAVPAPKRRSAPTCDRCPACVHDPARDAMLCDLTGAQVLAPDWQRGHRAQLCPRNMRAVALSEHDRQKYVVPIEREIKRRGKKPLYDWLTSGGGRARSARDDAAALRRAVG